MYFYEVKNGLLRIGPELCISMNELKYIRNVDIKVSSLPPHIEGNLYSEELAILSSRPNFLYENLNTNHSKLGIVATRSGFFFVPNGITEGPTNVSSMSEIKDDIELLLTFAPALSASDVQPNLNPTFYFTGRYTTDLEMAEKIEAIRLRYGISLNDVDEADDLSEPEI